MKKVERLSLLLTEGRVAVQSSLVPTLERATQGINICATDGFKVTSNFLDVPIPPSNLEKFLNDRGLKTQTDLLSRIATNDTVCLNIPCND